MLASLAAVRELYERAGVFDKARQLVEKYRERAESVADEIEPDELRRLMYYLIDTVLERPGRGVAVRGRSHPGYPHPDCRAAVAGLRSHGMPHLAASFLPAVP